MKKLSEQMSHVGQEAYEYAPEVAKLEVKLAQREQDCIDRTVEAHAAEADNEALTQWLNVVLDCADYTAGNCGFTEMVSAVLPKDVIEKARYALLEASK